MHMVKFVGVDKLLVRTVSLLQVLLYSLGGGEDRERKSSE